MPASWGDIPVDDIRSILIGLIGHDFGDRPEERIDDIRISRKGFAEYFCNIADVTPTDTVLDLGSGCGFGTYWISKRAKRVIACDISDAYLEFAKSQCSELSNIEFHKIANGQLDTIPNASVDKVIGMSVFIHMNVYDMYAYFKEFARILTSSGTVCIDLADGDLLDFSRPGERERWFLKAAEIYMNRESDLSGLMNWNSFRTVTNIAVAHGFTVKAKTGDTLLLQLAK